MTLYTDDDVERACAALAPGSMVDYHPDLVRDVQRVLDAVLPAIRKRWEEDVEAGGLPLVEHDRALILALADEWHDENRWVEAWLRRRAEVTP